MVADVLEHLDRHHPIEAPLTAGTEARWLEGADIRGHHREVAEAPVGRFGVDVGLLGAGVGDGDDLRRRVALGQEQRERSPAGSELEDPITVGDGGPVGGLGQGHLLGGGEIVDPLWPPAARVPETGAEDSLEERGRHLVVLAVGVDDVGGDGSGGPLGQQHPLAGLGRGRSTSALLGHLGPDPEVDAGPDHPIGQATGLGLGQQALVGGLPGGVDRQAGAEAGGWGPEPGADHGSMIPGTRGR